MDNTIPAVPKGCVVGRILHSTLDGPDAGVDPDTAVNVGTVTFTPAAAYRKLAADTVVTHSAMTAELDSHGHMHPLRATSDNTGSDAEDAIWLPTGTWSVTYRLNTGALPTHNIAVTEAHTAEAPLALFANMGDARGAGATYIQLTVPPGGQQGQVLVMADGSLSWGDVSGGGSSFTVTAGPVTLPTSADEGDTYFYRLTGDTLVNGEEFDAGRYGFERTATGWDWWRLATATTLTVLPDPTDTTNPDPGTLSASSITQTGFTLTVSDAVDDVALHATPYAFTTNGGGTWSAYQASPAYVASGLSAATGYSCNWRVRDAAGNVSTGTAQTVTTAAAVVSGTLAYQGMTSSATEQDVVTYAAAPLGTPSATREVIVLVTWWSSSVRAGASVTIGGVSATRDYRGYSGPTTTSGFELWRAVVPTGTTGDVVVTGNNAAAFTVAVWTTTERVTFLGGSYTTAAIGATSATVTNTSTVSGGFALAGFRGRQGSGGFSTTWTDATERYDSAAAQPVSGADTDTTTTSTAVTATFSVAVATAAINVGLGAYRWGV